VQDWTSRT